MQLTEAGQIFLIVVAALIFWSFILTKRWVARLSKGAKTSKIEFSYLFAVVFSISSIFFPFSYWVSTALYDLSTKPTYTAKIVGYTSEWVESTRTDSNNRSYTVEELKHTAQVSFKDNENQTRILDNSIRSTAIPIVGDTIQVVYSAGDRQVQEKSMRSFLLYIAALFMLGIMGFVLVAILAFGFHRDMQPFIRCAQFLIFRVTLPLGAMAMLAMLLYVLFEFFMLGNPQSHPIWVAVICSFFSLALLPLIYHILSGWKLYKEE